MPKATKRERQRQNRDARREAMVEAERRRRRFRTARNIAIGVVALLAVLVLVQVTRGDDDSSSDAGADSASASAVTCSNRKPSSPPKTDTYDAPPAPVLDPATTYEVRMHTSCGDIPIVLDAEQAPETVNSFVSLVQNEFYNGTTFHRIVTDFVDQGGDPTGTGSGGPGYSLPDEPPAGPYRAGDVAMANSGPGTTGSQFFLVVSKDGADQLNATAPAYSILGHMTDDGLKVAKKINTFGSSDGTPTRDIYVFDIGIVFNPSPTTSTAAP